MDVRCERCLTEYELEDGSVGDEGAPVQCTACGNTFMVTPVHVAPDLGEAADSAPAAAEWLLETPEGPAHRFRNLTSLQKWIIERKVTRDDRISRTGQAWRRLGDIVELAPFFDVVDDADRARAGVLSAQASGARKEAATSPGGPRSPGASMEAFMEPRTDVVALRGRMFLRLAVLLVVATAVAYAGITQIWTRLGDPSSRARLWPGHLPSFGVISRPRAPVEPRAAARPQLVPLPAEASRSPEAAPAHVAEQPAAAQPAAAHLEPAAPAREPHQASEPAKGALGEAPSYDKLVAEGDRLLGVGDDVRARKVYDDALKIRPWGVEALSGMGYLALDRGHNVQASNYFRRAVARSPTFGPAVFGLGEAYRATGKEELALQQYRRYVALDPNGTDVVVAQRQIQTIEAHLAAAEAAATVQPPSPP